MSEITKLVMKLKEFANEYAFADTDTMDVLNEATNVIEELSAKLHAANMERSSQYYHDGWIPCDERLPEKNGVYLISYEDAVALMEFFNGKWFLYQRQPAEEAGTILAWQPLPEPYEAESEVE